MYNTPAPTRPPIITLIAVLLATILIAALAPAAAAQPSTPERVQQQINDHLARHPGGKQINTHEIAYDGGTFIIGFAAKGYTTQGADCTSGWFCFYDHPNYVWPRGRLSDCGWQDLTRWGWHNRVESAYYNMNIGSVIFIDHGPYSDHSADIGLFTTSTSKRAVPELTTHHRNKADHVYRYCR